MNSDRRTAFLSPPPSNASASSTRIASSSIACAASRCIAGARPYVSLPHWCPPVHLSRSPAHRPTRRLLSTDPPSPAKMFLIDDLTHDTTSADDSICGREPGASDAPAASLTNRQRGRVAFAWSLLACGNDRSMHSGRHTELGAAQAGHQESRGDTSRGSGSTSVCMDHDLTLLESSTSI